jgi:uncharacterized protein
VARLEIRVAPRAGRSAIGGFDAAGRLVVRVAAPPVEGRANEALCAFLAGALKIPRRRVRLLRGDKGRTKLVEIEGLTDQELRIKLENL